jgi:Short-chain dehydrogenases of various substrate specificities
MRRFQRALITGATSGIGAAFADQLAPTTGLLIPGRNAGRLAATERRLLRPGRTVETMLADLADPASVDALAARADAFGIDLLINNAGLGPVGPFIDNDEALERATVMVNVVALVTLTRRLLPGMLQRAKKMDRRAGLIIVASTAAFAPVPYFATYTASKAFDLNFAEAIAEELRREPIDVVALCPGPTRTAFGTGAGFGMESLPGAADPAGVARAGLAGLGRGTVRVSSQLGQAAMTPVVWPRRVLTGALGAAMRVMATRKR